MEREIKIFPDVERLNQFAAEEFVRLSGEAIARHGIFSVALSGGSTPKKLYALLASDEFHRKIDWQKIHFFFGDERCVLPDDDESNFRMASENLFSKINLPLENIHRFLTEKQNPIEIAEQMEMDIRRFFNLKSGESPRFDLIFLGMGADGHTASLFPESSALDETQKIVTENFVAKMNSMRLTFTFPAINHARQVIFLIAGADKSAVLKKVLQESENIFPTQTVKPLAGKLCFLIDKAAAADLD